MSVQRDDHAAHAEQWGFSPHEVTWAQLTTLELLVCCAGATYIGDGWPVLYLDPLQGQVCWSFDVRTEGGRHTPHPWMYRIRRDGSPTRVRRLPDPSPIPLPEATGGAKRGCRTPGGPPAPPTSVETKKPARSNRIRVHWRYANGVPGSNTMSLPPGAEVTGVERET